MNTTFSVVTSTEVYVFVRGCLVWKRWRGIAASALFQTGPEYTETLSEKRSTDKP